MQKKIESNLFQSMTYLVFSVGIFLVIGVRISNGGIFHEKIIPIAMNYGFIFIFFSLLMWCLSGLYKKWFKTL